MSDNVRLLRPCLGKDAAYISVKIIGPRVHVRRPRDSRMVRRIALGFQHRADTFEIMHIVDPGVVAVINPQKSIPQYVEPTHSMRKNYRVRHRTISTSTTA